MLINYQDSRPIYEQIVDRYRHLILMGALAPDEQMPSVRSLAMELSTNPNTVQKAYAEAASSVTRTTCGARRSRRSRTRSRLS